MTDEEILKRLAELEGGVEDWVFANMEGADSPYYVHLGDAGEVVNFNPLTDDAQCMALIKRHSLTVGRISDMELPPPHLGDWWVQCLVDDSTLFSEAEHEYLNRAVCLAIIEAHRVVT